MNPIKYTLQYNMKGAPQSLLWEYISTNIGLSQWFADDVSNEGKKYFFTWHKNITEAQLIGIRGNSFVRFHWSDDENSKSYFEFKILVSELTDDKTLQITDFADDDEDCADSKELWDKQIQVLKRIIGCV